MATVGVTYFYRDMVFAGPIYLFRKDIPEIRDPTDAFKVRTLLVS